MKRDPMEVINSHIESMGRFIQMVKDKEIDISKGELSFTMGGLQELKDVMEDIKNGHHKFGKQYMDYEEMIKKMASR